MIRVAQPWHHLPHGVTCDINVATGSCSEIYFLMINTLYFSQILTKVAKDILRLDNIDEDEIFQKIEF